MTNKRYLTTFSIAMINIIAIDNLRSLTFGAKFGTSLVGYYFLATILFFAPISLVCAELASRYPKQGGMYVWAKEAFGHNVGFIIIWIQWIYNVIWFPSIVIFIWVSIAQLTGINTMLGPLTTLLGINIIFILCTAANMFGMHFSSRISTYGAIFGTLIPMLIICSLGISELSQLSLTHLNFQQFLPNLSEQHESLPYLVELIFGLVGIEMSAVHADKVINPASAYPRAILITAMVILSSLIFSSLSVYLLVPKDELNIIAGIMQCAEFLLEKQHLSWLFPIFGLLIIVGSLTTTITWIIGVTRGLFVATKDGFLPSFLAKTNSQGVPAKILLVQMIIFIILSLAVVLFPLEVAFVMISAITTQLSLVIYIILFLAAIKLRAQRPDTKFFKAPFLRSACVVGILTSVSIFILGFFIPLELNYDRPYLYSTIIGAVVIMMLLPPVWGIRRVRRVQNVV